MFTVIVIVVIVVGLSVLLYTGRGPSRR